MRVAFHTLGCKVNQYETEAIREAFVLRGSEIVGEDESADVYIVNTCTVTNIADRKSRQYIRKMKGLNPQALMVVTGCYAQVSTEQLQKMPEVDLIIGNSLKSGICDAVFDALEAKAAEAKNAGDESTTEAEADITVDTKVLSYNELDFYDDMGIVTSDESSMCRAYIKIEEGCNRFCAYCLIPYARGKVRSRDPDEIVEEAKRLIAKGYREIVLTGINTALYGTEPEASSLFPEGSTGLETIIRRIDALEGDFRIRLSSLEPTVVDVNDVKKLLGYEKLCHHLHLSIQSGSDHVLSMMNRHYTVSEYLDIVKALKAFDPCYAITTDIIAGFPGETEEDHANTLETVDKSGFGRIHVFRFSPRKGTRAEGMAGQIDGKTKSRRAAELAEAAERELKRFIEINKQKTHRFLAEEREGLYVTGYTDNYIRVYVNDPEEQIEQGEFYMVRLTEAHEDGAFAEFVNSEDA